MQLITHKKFDLKTVKECLIAESKFIQDILIRAGVPERIDPIDEDGQNEEQAESTRTHLPANQKKTLRAKSLMELQQRLEAFNNKKKLSYKEKLTKKGLKNRMKKKTQRTERNAQAKLKNAVKLTEKSEENSEIKAEKEGIKVELAIQKHEKPVFNKDDKMVFSKIDFNNLGKQKKVKKETDLKKVLKLLKEQDKKVEEMKQSGEIGKAVEVKEKAAWKNALAKAEGQKVKDDQILLMKSVKKKEQKQRSSKKKWEKRIEGVEKAKEERQKKRTDNISKRKKDKKINKSKKAVKRGKIIAGF
ncbi:unnamed protein product [Phaedon cochleariae]|uniref:Ribosomal RNA-processing protein 14/surfeit locus protein 6 C-terminal domain-containing protein n=1 Tax=Phaedon cochleariae TaxID=80249 RepID=A0A9P0DR29_PHACE|nr:unnamed protein product [Phaedon cochleariae]